MYVLAYTVCCKIINLLLPLSAGFLWATIHMVSFHRASFHVLFSGVYWVYRVFEDPSDEMYVQAYIAARSLTHSCLCLQDSCQ